MLTQEEQEKKQAELGKARARNQIEKAAEKGYVGESTIGRRLISQVAGFIADELESFKSINSKDSFRRNRAVVWALEVLEELGSETVAITALRVALNRCWVEPVDLHKVAGAIGYELSDEAFFRKIREEGRTSYNRAIRRGKGKRSRSTRRQRALRSLKQDGVEVNFWPREMRVSVGLVFVEHIRQRSDLFTVEVTYKPGKKARRLALMSLTEECRRWFARAKDRYEAMNPVWLPMVEPPRPWVSVLEGGQHSDQCRRRPFTRPRHDIGFGLYESGMDQVFSAANAVQATGWRVNEDALEAVQSVFNADPERLGLTDDRKLFKATRDLALAKEHSGRPVWLQHFADFRGRLYAQSQLSYQSWDLMRGMLVFDELCPIDTPEAERWFKIHGANSWGEDKVSFDDRVEWVESNRELIEAVGNDPLDCTAWLDADKPVAFLTWCMEMTEFWGQGLGYLSRVPVGMDGTNNGLQILSLLLRDPEGATWTNCVPLEKPNDIYGRVAHVLFERLRSYRDDKIVNPKEPLEIQMTGTQAARAWLEFFAFEPPPRSLPKRGTMTRPYSVSHYSFHGYVRETYDELVEKWGRKVVEHDPYPCTALLANQMWKAVDDVVVASQVGMRWMKDTVKVLTDHGVAPLWFSPSEFPVRQDYRKSETQEVHLRLRCDSWKVKRMYSPKVDLGPDSLNPRAHQNGISPNFIHSIDAALLHRTVNATSSRIKSYRMIHDDYGCHAQHAPFLAKKLRETAVEIFEGDLLGDFRDQLQTLLGPAGVELPELPEYGDLDVRELVNADYFFA